MGLVAICENGLWTTIEIGQPSPSQKNDRNVSVDTRISDIDQIAAHLGKAVRLAQNLSPTDARRARDFFHAASGMMSATTFLPSDDQKLFGKSLRGGGDDAA
jgi:hypothetical protein